MVSNPQIQNFTYLSSIDNDNDHLSQAGVELVSRVYILGSLYVVISLSLSIRAFHDSTDSRFYPLPTPSLLQKHYARSTTLKIFSKFISRTIQGRFVNECHPKLNVSPDRPYHFNSYIASRVFKDVIKLLFEC